MIELKHYGVLGMKWGVRKKPDLKTLRPSIKRGDTIIKKGTNFQRIASGSNMAYTKGVFLSYKAADKDQYRGVLGRIRAQELLKSQGSVTLKQLTFKAGKDIVIPSKQKRIEELNNLLKTDKEAVLALINEGEQSAKRSKGYKGDRDYEADMTMYERFNHALALGADKHPVILKYYKALKKQGYDAIPDTNDIKLSTFKAQAPIIVFDTLDSIGSIKVKNLSAGEVFNAYDRSISKQMIRNLPIIGKRKTGENLTDDTINEKRKAVSRQILDKKSFNKNYSLTDLAKDWQTNGLARRDIKKVNDLMNTGKTHDEAVKEVLKLRNKLTSRVLSTIKL